MAERGRPIPAATMVRIKYLAAVCRCSIRHTAKEAGVDRNTVRKYLRFSESPRTNTSLRT